MNLLPPHESSFSRSSSRALNCADDPSCVTSWAVAHDLGDPPVPHIPDSRRGTRQTPLSPLTLCIAFTPTRCRVPFLVSSRLPLLRESQPFFHLIPKPAIVTSFPPIPFPPTSPHPEHLFLFALKHLFLKRCCQGPSSSPPGG